MNKSIIYHPTSKLEFQFSCLFNFSLSDEDLLTVEILLGIFLVNDFEINIYDRSQELVGNITVI